MPAPPRFALAQALLCAPLLAVPGAASAAAGDLDGTFAPGGTRGHRCGTDDTSLPDAIVPPNGRVVVAGSDGAAFVVHAMPDDQETDPSGNSGDRIACGVFSAG